VPCPDPQNALLFYHHCSSASTAMHKNNLNIESNPMKTITSNFPTRRCSVGFIPTATLAAVAVLGFLFAAPSNLRADPPLPGAVFTSDSTCSGVDLNIYGNKDDVYVNGGPSHPGAASLPDGSYCVLVTSPDGTVLGKSAADAVSVSGGVFAACYQLSSILNTATSGFTTAGYDDTNNPGGEYKVWISTNCDFTNSSTKTDNFKVRAGGGGPGDTATLCVTKFYDANANGVKDGLEQDINGWLFQVFADDNLQLTRHTPRCIVVDPGTYTIIEGTPVESNWLHTTDSEVAVAIAANETGNVQFGNVCLGTGGGLTLGFWSNKNGQKLETSADFTSLNALWLRNADGSNKDFNQSTANNKTALNTWLLNATATNMAYMLSAQLAAMRLNVNHNFVSGAALVHTGGCGNTGFDGSFITINDLMAAANNELYLHPVTKDGNPARAYQECLKNALDDANNNRNFVGSSPCSFSFGN
jgi:hypothetical protein